MDRAEETAGRPRVLVVDDDPGMRETLQDILLLQGFDAGAAADGLEALEELRRIGFQLVLMDIMMPRMNGVEALRAIRREQPGAVVVLMTGYTVDDLIAEARQNGCRHILHKPLDVPALLRLLPAIADA